MKLKDKIMMIATGGEGIVKSGSFRLRDRIEVEGGLMGRNESYRPQDNLMESRVLSNIASVNNRH